MLFSFIFIHDFLTVLHSFSCANTLNRRTISRDTWRVSISSESISDTTPTQSSHNSQRKNTLQDLNDDVLLYITSFFSSDCYSKMNSTCKQLYVFYVSQKLVTKHADCFYAEKSVKSKINLQNFFQFLEKFSYNIVERKNRILVDWSFKDPSKKKDLQEKIVQAAARLGELEILKYIGSKIGRESPAFLGVSSFAAKGNQLEMLKWMKEHKWCWDERGICAGAAEAGDIEILRWARQNNCPWDVDTTAFAARQGHLKVLQFARENGCPWNSRVCSLSAYYGHLAILKYAREHNCPWGTTVCAFAAGRGNLEVLRWARKNGCPWDSSVCRHAAYNGHLSILIWAREHGCPWNSSTCAAAVFNGHTRVLQWALENGCPWTPNIFTASATRGHHEIIQWAQENGYISS